MKQIIIIFFISLLSVGGFSQEISIEETMLNYEDAVRPAFSIFLEPGTKEVKKKLKDYIDDRYDVKMKGIGFLTNKDVLTAEKVQIKTISSKRINFYAKVVEENNQTRLSIFSAFGYDIPISPKEDNTAYLNMRGLLVDFLNDYLPGYYTEQVEERADNVADLKDEREDLKEDLADNKKEIDEKLKEINELREENEELNSELSETAKTLLSREEELNSMKLELQKVNLQLKKLSKGN